MRYKASVLILLVVFTNCDRQVKNSAYLYYDGWKEGKPLSYYGEKPEIDTSTFRVFAFEAYAKDKNSVYHLGNKIEGADAYTFEAIGTHFARDKNVGYFGSIPIKASCGNSFVQINQTITTDGYEVFYLADPLNVTARKNFQIVSEEGEDCWSSDGKYYYFNNYKVPSEDFKNLIFFKGRKGVAKDKNWVYFRNRKINFDAKGRKIIDTIDAGSFKMLNDKQGKDKFGDIDIFKGRVGGND